MEQIRQAYERTVTGRPALTRNLSLPERECVAVHEAGHALVSRHTIHSEPNEKVTITPRGKAMGYVMYRPGEDRNFHSRSELLDRIIILLGGRAAEEAVLGEVSSGAAD